jgi:hypothetical protein
MNINKGVNRRMTIFLDWPEGRVIVVEEQNVS